MNKASRRAFLRAGLMGTLAAGVSTGAAPFSAFASEKKSKVALRAGDDRAGIIFQSLTSISEDIKRAAGDRPILIKPNNVSTTVPLCATHVDALIGMIEFFHSIGKTDIVIAESAASGPTFEGYDHYGYLPLEGKYGVKLVDLDEQPYERIFVVHDDDIRPRAVRASSWLLDNDFFVISAAVMKTHDRVVATLALKNIVFGAPIKDEGFRWGAGRREGAVNDKPIAHGGGFRGVNYNLFAMAPRLHPDLAIIDGYEGMEGNGPVGGTPVDHRVAVASLDWLAADRVGVELMGIDFANVGYLNYCAEANMGETDLERIEILGDSIADHRREYRMHDRFEDQLIWKS